MLRWLLEATRRRSRTGLLVRTLRYRGLRLLCAARRLLMFAPRTGSSLVRLCGIGRRSLLLIARLLTYGRDHLRGVRSRLLALLLCPIRIALLGGGDRLILCDR